MDTAYSYGNERLTNERFMEWTRYYVYDPRGSVTGVTDSKGMLWQSDRYNANGDFTFGKPQYNNVYSDNAERYNPNMGSWYRRAKCYNVAHANLLTEDWPWLGDSIVENGGRSGSFYLTAEGVGFIVDVSHVEGDYLEFKIGYEGVGELCKFDWHEAE